ncbi:MAG: NUDIX domain-containing protein [bacterium]
MSHIHDKIDFVSTAFIVYRDKVLLVHHKILKTWLPVGGHIELDEDPIEALYREIKEETGIDKKDISVVTEKPDIKIKKVKFLFTPRFLDIHYFSAKHRHTNFIYFIKSKTDKVILNKKESNNIRWFTKSEILNKKYKIIPQIKFLTMKALKEIPS